MPPERDPPADEKVPARVAFCASIVDRMRSSLMGLPVMDMLQF